MAIKRLYDTLVGATVSVNQLYGKTGNSTTKGITFSNTSGRITISGVNDGTGTSYYVYNFTTNIPANRVVAFRSGVDGGSTTTYDAQLVADDGLNIISYDGKSYTVTKKNYPWKGCNLNVRTGYNADQNPIMFAPEIIDVTAMFGSTIADYLYSLEQTTAGAGIAKLREWGFLTDEYIPYNPGSLESVEATAHKMVGFNQFDGELVAGYWDASTGALVGGGANWKACKNYIKCVPNTAYAYFATGSGNSRGSIVFYDADKNVISAISGGTGAGVSLFTTPSNCRYFTFYLSTEFSDNICINLSNPDRNGEYEPYSAHTYDLGTDTLRGLFKLDSNNNLYADGDTKTSDGTVTRRYGVVDLGTLTWNVINTNIFYADISGKLANNANIICSANYINAGVYENYNNFTDKTIASSSSVPRIAIKDSAYTDAAAFKSAMSGVMLVYELATPTTETSTPFTSPQICDPDGTEEYVTSNGVPVGHETRYQL